MSKEVIIMRKIMFHSAHRLHSQQLSDKENKIIYGKCNNPNGHGHEYILTVALKGQIDPVTGMLFNLSELKEILDNTIMKEFDHKHLNLDTPYFKDKVSTAENIVVVCWEMLSKTKAAPYLYYLELQETSNNAVRFFGKHWSNGE